MSRLAYRVHYTYQSSEMMKNLYSLVQGKDYFVITSNGEDHFTPAGFDADRIFEIEEKVTEYRCAAHCHESIYNNREDVLRMAKEEKNGKVPAELLPHCPRCGALMEPNAPMDQSFFQTGVWKKKAADYENFVKKYHDKRLVILELGIGWRNKLIKESLMQIAAKEANCTYITFNKGEIYIPKEIAYKSVGVDGDIKEAMQQIAIICL